MPERLAIAHSVQIKPFISVLAARIDGTVDIAFVDESPSAELD